MGQLFSRSRKKTSVTDILEQVEKEIRALEDYQRSTEQKQKRLVGSFILYSIIFYFASAAFLYLYCFPSSFREQCLYAIPLLLFPFLIWLFKHVLQKYFKWKIEMNSYELTELLRRRRTILNEVKEQETYKKAKEILEKFDPEYKLQKQKKKDAEALLAKQKEAASGMELRRRSFPARIKASPPRPLPTANVPPNVMIQGSQRFQPNGRQWLRPPGPPMARPILPRERGISDRLVDYLVGDGPANRYALICRQCCSHNGMALKEEFEYISFRCCYCYTLNPARKERPCAPSLPSAATVSVARTSELEDDIVREELETEKSKVESEILEREENVEEDATESEQFDNKEVEIIETDEDVENPII